MHESELARKLVAVLEATVKERGAKGVKSVKVRLGGIHWIDTDAFRELFSLFSQGTVSETAELEIEEAPPKAKCLQCGTIFVPHDHHPVCPQCGSNDLEVTAEPDMQILELSILTADGGTGL
ncbi:MAG: hydrogenase maturation nickel metallochaperone HypA/HybF [Candidatus Fervidibacter sp.]|uniref:hydrogenase maturation nickel metallochaperone HypA/HybF n=1 Tax=Candidatus Fervidibacter sp. TaxID=3100871 RepID=UPI00404AB215